MFKTRNHNIKISCFYGKWLISKNYNIETIKQIYLYH